MNDRTINTTPAPADASAARSIQACIDERPIWSDGTAVGMTPMTAMQWRILGLAAAGKFFEGFVVFMTGVALPLIAVEYNINAFQHGLVGAASLAGILIGALFLGGLADRFGCKPMFIAEMFIFVAFLCLLVASPLFGLNSFALLVFFLFGIGVALGCDYPTAHLIISESIPSTDRGRLVLGAFGFQALGALLRGSGASGQPVLDHLKPILVGLQQLIAVAGEEIESVDLNPVIVTNNSDLVAVDALIVRKTSA